MNPLSIWTYYLNNKRKVFPILAIIVCSLLGISAPRAILDTVEKDVYQGFGFYDKYFELYLNEAQANSLTKAELEAKLNDIPGIDHVLEGQALITQRYALGGDLDTPVYFLTQVDQAKLLNYLQVSVSSGNLPKLGENEVVLTSGLVINKSLALGDHFGQKLDKNDTIPGEYNVSGIINTNQYSFGLGSLEYLSKRASLTHWFLIAPKANEYDIVNQALTKLEEEHSELGLATRSTLRARVEMNFKSLKNIFFIVSMLLLVVITASAALLKIIFFMQRANEFGLLSAIGYSKWLILKKALTETLGIILGGWVIGLGFTAILFHFVNQYLLAPKAFVQLNLLDTVVISYTLPVPIAIAVFSVLTVAYQLLTMDAITIIERRD